MTCPIPYKPRIPNIRWVLNGNNRFWMGFVGTVMMFTVRRNVVQHERDKSVLYFQLEDMREFLEDDDTAKEVAKLILKNYIENLYIGATK